jgi:hypothetical protein
LKKVFFRPWIGDNYSAGFCGRRVLVLGESHYQWDQGVDAYEELTNDCIREQIDGEWSKSFWTNIVITFLNRNPTLEDKSEFWHSVVFYNYVQEFAGFGPRISPTSEMWLASEPAFWEVLDLLRPQSIIVLGYRLWSNLPDIGDRGPHISTAPQEWTWWYPLGKSVLRALAYGIRHPASGFSGRAWHPHVMKVLELSESRQQVTLQGESIFSRQA